MQIDLPYLRSDTDRHGNERMFVRRFGRSIRIREQPGTVAFASAYNTALEALGCQHVDKPPGCRAAPVGTLGWLAATYFAAFEFTSLPPSSQSNRRRSLVVPT